MSQNPHFLSTKTVNAKHQQTVGTDPPICGVWPELDEISRVQSRFTGVHRASYDHENYSHALTRRARAGCYTSL